MIYLDNNATTQPDPTVVEAMLPYWKENYLNPASVAGELFGASQPIHSAKEALSNLLGGDPEEFCLTSGATESNNWVLQSVALESIRQTGTCHILISAIEHPSILETASALTQWNPKIRFDRIPVHQDGLIDLDALSNLVTTDTALVSIIFANNETGVIQPLKEAANIVKRHSPSTLFHSDATQAVGKVPIDLNTAFQQVDLLSLSAHKFHGPKGIGALFIRQGTRLNPLIYGGSQQAGMRAGTENPALAAGIATAAELASAYLPNVQETRNLRDSLESSIASKNLGIQILSANAHRLPNTTLLLFQKHEGEMLVHMLLEHGIVTSTGSACSRGSDEPSHVVTAMGIPFQVARNTLRFSLSRYSTRADVAKISDILQSIV